MIENDKNCKLWLSKFVEYFNFVSQCEKDIIDISNIKKDIDALIGKQGENDIIFYKGLIDNSYYFYSKSLKIRKRKMLNDLNHIYQIICKKSSIENLNRTNFETILKKYIQVKMDTSILQKNATKLTWVKSDIIEDLNHFEKEIESTLEYHMKIISYFHQCLELEKAFFCGSVI